MLDKAVQFISEGNYLAFGIATVIGILFNIQKILTVADAFRKRRIELLKEAIGVTSKNENLQRHFQDELEGEYFRISHNVRMDKGIRDASIDLYLKLERQLPFVNFIRAKNSLELDEGILRVKISNFDKIGFYYNLIFGFLLFMSGTLLLLLIDSLKQPTVLGVLTWIILCIFLMAFGFFFLSQTSSYHSAIKIKQFTNK